MTRSRIIAGKAVIVIEAVNLVDKTLGKIRTSLHRFANTVGAVGEAAFRTGFLGSIASGLIVNQFVRFDDALRKLRVNLDLFGASAKQVKMVMDPLEATIRKLALETPFSPTQVAEAAVNLAKGGFNPEEIKASLAGILDLARATGSELDQAGEIAIRVMRNFSVGPEQTSDIISQMVRTARKGLLDIEDIGVSMKYASGTANTLGVSLQKMLAVLAVLSDRGLLGSTAGTSLNTSLSELVRKAGEIESKTGVTLIEGVRKDGKKAIDVLATLENLFDHASKLSLQQQKTLFANIFHLRGARPMEAIRDEIKHIRQLSVFIAEAGDEGQVAAKIMDEGLGGAFRRLISTVQQLNITLGASLEKSLTQIAMTIKGLLGALDQLAAKNSAIVAGILFSPVIILAAGLALMTFAKVLRIVATAAGALKSSLIGIGGLIAKATAAQVTSLVKLNAARKAMSALPPRLLASQGIKKQYDLIKQLEAKRTATTSSAAKRRLGIEIATAKRKLRHDRTAAAKLAKVAPTRIERRRLRDSQRRVKFFRRPREQHLRATYIGRAGRGGILYHQAKIEAAAHNTLVKRLKEVRTQRAKLYNDTVAQAKKVKASTAVYVKEVQLQRQLLTVERQLAHARAQRRLFPALSRSFQQTALEGQRRALRRQIAGLSTRTRAGTIISPAKALTAERARQAALAQKLTLIDRAALALTNSRIVAQQRYTAKIVESRRHLVAASQAKRKYELLTGVKLAGGKISTIPKVGLAEFQRRAARAQRLQAARAAVVGAGAGAGRKLATATKSVFSVGRAARGVLTIFGLLRKVFSLSGLTTIIEILILFGDKIPGVNTVLARFGKAFGGAFKSIGNIATFAAGPLDLIRASIEAFVAGRADLGVEGLKQAFMALASIIGNQLVAAWNRFKEHLGPVFDFIRNAITIIEVTITSLVNSIGVVMESFFSLLGEGLGTLNSAVGDPVSMLNNATKGPMRHRLAEDVIMLGPMLFNWLARFQVVFNSVSETFLLGLRYAFEKVNPFTSVGAEARLGTRTADLIIETNDRLQKLKDFLKEDRMKVRKSLAKQAAIEGKLRADAIEGEHGTGANIRGARAKRLFETQQTGSSWLISRAMQQIAAEMRKALIPIPEVKPPQRVFPQEITPDLSKDTLVRKAFAMADALVGSAQSTRRNLLRPGKQIEEKQLAEARMQTELLQKIAENEGAVLAP